VAEFLIIGEMFVMITRHLQDSKVLLGVSDHCAAEVLLEQFFKNTNSDNCKENFAGRGTEAH
jgi:hypothetical protein